MRPRGIQKCGGRAEVRRPDGRLEPGPDECSVRAGGGRLAVKASAQAPMNRPMRVSRIAPIVALACAAACGVAAVLSSHAGEWHPAAVIAVLFAFAGPAHRLAVTPPTRPTPARQP